PVDREKGREAYQGPQDDRKPGKTVLHRFNLSSRGAQSDPFEQAQIDGAGKSQIFWHITLPLIRPDLLATVFIRLMDALRTVDE
ncbi:ABC transporter permease subunit, partial [Rhizobium ruizarguesonis]